MHEKIKNLSRAQGLIDEAIEVIREVVSLSDKEELTDNIIIYDLQRIQSEIDFLKEEV